MFRPGLFPLTFQLTEINYSLLSLGFSIACFLLYYYNTLIYELLPSPAPTPKSLRFVLLFPQVNRHVFRMPMPAKKGRQYNLDSEM